MPIGWTINYDGSKPDPLTYGTGHFAGLNSKYILEKIKKTRFANRVYAYELVALNNYITKGVDSFISSRGLGLLSAKYPREYKALLKEKESQDPGRPAKSTKARATVRRKKTGGAKEAPVLKTQKKEWLQAGGIV